ncbi:MAG: DUF58 domain-containing protein [Chloroflexi bacterium]|nr:DUF58 domain-containing protein [Chloroflexota bacterium]
MIRTSVRLTSYVVLIAAVFLLFLQIFSPAPAVKFVLVILLGTLVVSYVWARQLSRGVLLERQRRYGWAQVGDVIQERFTMHNDGWVPVLWAEVRDHSDLPGYNASRAVGLGIRSSIRWTTTGTCQRRGIYTLGPVRITMGDPFGLFEVALVHGYTESFVVYPPVVAVPELIDPRGRVSGAARANARSIQMTTNASSVRAYAPGDALKRIHWRSTARRSMEDREQLFVKEFDLEPSGDVWLVLDMDARVHAGHDLESTEEYAVILAASLANQALRANHAVGMVTYQQDPVIIQPQKGPQQLWELLRLLAGAHATASVSMRELLSLFEPIMGRGMSAALITPSSNPEWVKGVSDLLRRGIHPTGVLLDAQSFGGSDGNLRGIMGSLADLGISSHVINKSYRFDYVTQKRQQLPEFKVLGTGRVVVIKPRDERQTQWVPLGRPEGEQA